MLLLIDNYDSFTFNLAHLIVAATGREPVVLRNDAENADTILERRPTAIYISPGPKRPEEAGECIEVIRRAPNDLPIFGVCLGMQAIGVAFGARVDRAAALMHGKVDPIRHDGDGVFADLPSPIDATRYHSLAVLEDGFPSELSVNARADDGSIMALRHRSRPIHGVQFHPESIGSAFGDRMLQNFMQCGGLA